MSKGKVKTDELCRYYVDAMAFFMHNVDVLEETAQRKRREGKDSGNEEKAARRILCAKEGVQRMLSDRAKALECVIDPAETLAGLAELKTRARDKDEDAVLNNAIALIVRQREKLTNADRGRRALQKQLGKVKRQKELLGKEACALKENNLELRQALAPLISEREKLLTTMAQYHCAHEKCQGCPFEKHCHDEQVSTEARTEMQQRMRDTLLGDKTKDNNEA